MSYGEIFYRDERAFVEVQHVGITRFHYYIAVTRPTYGEVVYIDQFQLSAIVAFASHDSLFGTLAQGMIVFLHISTIIAKEAILLENLREVEHRSWLQYHRTIAP